MQPSIKLAIVVVLLLAIGGGAYALISLDSQGLGNLMEVEVSEVIQNPKNFNERNVVIEGKVIKEPKLPGRPLLLSDGDSLLLLKPSEGLEGYLGLTIRAKGIVNYIPQTFGLPATSLEVQDVEVLVGDQTVMIEVLKEGQELGGGRPNIGRLLVVDNNGGILIYDTRRDYILFQGQLSDAELLNVKKTILENDFLEMEPKEYVLAGEIDGVVFRVKLKAIVNSDGEIKQNELRWTEPAHIPDQLLAVQDMINDLLGEFGKPDPDPNP